MEDISKDEAAPPATAARSKLRYPLRSATKSKEEKTTPPEVSKSSVTKRGRPASSIISKSMNVLDLSGKEKPSKPPRRLSIPAKPNVSSVSKTTCNITPISEVRAKRSVNSQGRSDTPASDISKSGNRKRFSTLSSASYWLSQIKLSESAAKHSISLTFFKLALDAGCEPIQRIRDELKSYARRHNLVELGELAKEVFESYNITENLEQSQVSETISQVPEEGTRSSDDDVHSSSSAMGTGKLKPKSLNVDALQVSTVAESAKKENSQKTNNSSTRSKGSINKSSTSAKSVTETGGRNLQRKPGKASKQDSKKEKDNIKKQGKKGASEEANPLPAKEIVVENKENMGASPSEDISLAEVL